MEYTTDRMSCLRKLGETQEWLRFYEKQLERTSRPTTKKGDMLAISMYFGMIGYIIPDDGMIKPLTLIMSLLGLSTATVLCAYDIFSKRGGYKLAKTAITELTNRKEELERTLKEEGIAIDEIEVNRGREEIKEKIKKLTDLL